MKVLVIVVTYNALQWIDRCLASLLNSTIPVDCIVIDNMSTDDTVKYIKKSYKWVHLVSSKKNLGFGQGNNIGLQYAIDNNYEFVYLLNQDAWIFPDTLRNLIDVYNLHTEYGILSPFQMQANEEHLDKNFKISLSRVLDDYISDFYRNKFQDVYSLPDVMAAHWLISRMCLLKVGGFSPTFTQYGEDNNYIERATYHGFKIGVVPSAKAIHDRANRSITKKKVMDKFYTNSLVESSSITNYSISFWGRLFYYSVVYIVSYRSLDPVKSVLKIIKQYPKIKHNRELSKNECAFLKH